MSQIWETLDKYLHSLKYLNGDCNYKDISIEKCREAICKDFISSLRFNSVSQSLFEIRTLDLVTAFDQTRILEHVKKKA